MVVAGMTPMQVIFAATRNSAEFLRIADAGALKAGKSDAFIVLEANPLDDITNTRRIFSVYLRGRPWMVALAVAAECRTVLQFVAALGGPCQVCLNKLSTASGSSESDATVSAHELGIHRQVRPTG